jgi:hypothetical protein
MDPVTDTAIAVSLAEEFEAPLGYVTYLLESKTAEEAAAILARGNQLISEGEEVAEGSFHSWWRDGINPTLRQMGRAAKYAERSIYAYLGYKGAKGSLSAAQGMAKSNRIRKALADFGQFERRIKKKVKRDLGLSSTKKKKARKLPNKSRPNTGIARGMRYARTNFKKVKRIKKTSPSKYVKQKYDNAGSVSAESAVWLNVHGNGGANKFHKGMAFAICRAILARHGFHPRTMADPVRITGVNNSSLCRLQIKTKGVLPATGVDSTSNTIVVLMPGDGTTRSFQEVATELETYLTTEWVLGRYMYAYDLKDQTTGIFVQTETVIEDSILDIYTTAIISIQNQTLAASGSDTADRNNIHAQTLKGKQYMFNNAAAVVHEELEDPFGSIQSAVQQFQDEWVVDGVQTLQGQDGSGNLIKHPQRPGALFKNCKGEANLILAPGQSKKVTMSLKFKGTLKAFQQKYLLRERTQNILGVAPRGGWGKSTWFCFERANRSGSAMPLIAYNVEFHNGAHLTLKQERHSLVVYDNV